MSVFLRRFLNASHLKLMSLLLQQVSSRGWTYICRVLGNHYYNVGDGWEKVLDSGTKASATAIYLGEGQLGRSKEAQHEGHFYLYKSKSRGRKFKRSKDRAARAAVTAKAEECRLSKISGMKKILAGDLA